MVKAIWGTWAALMLAMLATPRRAVPDDLVHSEEVAALLKCSVNALYVMRHRGQGPPAYKVHRRLLFSRAEVLMWLADHRDDGGPAQVAV